MLDILHNSRGAAPWYMIGGTVAVIVVALAILWLSGDWSATVPAG